MKFSVVVPLHDKEPYVARAIESVLAQTHRDFELIVVDDASTDRGPEIVRSFDDPRVRLLRRDVPGPGGYAARNLGIREARNEWIAFLDADDLWTPGFLEGVVRLRERFPEARAFCSAFVARYADRDEPGEFARKGPTEPVLRGWDDFLRAIAENLWPFWTGVAVFRREDLLAAGGFPEARYGRGGDLDTWFRTLAIAKHWAYSPEPSAIHFREIPGQVTRRVRQDPAAVFVADTLKAAIAGETDAGRRALLLRARRSKIAAVVAANLRAEGLSWGDLLRERDEVGARELWRLARLKVRLGLRKIRAKLPPFLRFRKRTALLAGAFFALLALSSVPAGARTLFESDFDRDDVCWPLGKDRPADCANPLVKEGPAPAVDADPAGGPGRAVKFELAFDPANRKQVRSELRLPRDREPAFAAKRERDFEYRFRIFFPDDWATDSRPEIVAQWRFHDHQVRKGVKSTGSPNVLLEIRNDSLRVRILANGTPIPADAPETEPGLVAHRPEGTTLLHLGRPPRGRWTSFLFRIRWGTPDGGVVRVWMDDSLAIDWKGRNMYAQPKQPVPYFKFGIYKWPWKSAKEAPEVVLRRLWFDDVSVRAGWSDRPESP